MSDSGDTFAAALAHIENRGHPAELRTAVLHHKTVSAYTPDYYVQRVVKWRWFIYPWALAEDLGFFIRAMRPRPAGVEAIAARLAHDHGIRIARPVLLDVLAMLKEDNE